MKKIIMNKIFIFITIINLNELSLFSIYHSVTNINIVGQMGRDFKTNFQNYKSEKVTFEISKHSIIMPLNNCNNDDDQWNLKK